MFGEGSQLVCHGFVDKTRHFIPSATSDPRYPRRMKTSAPTAFLNSKFQILYSSSRLCVRFSPY